MSESPTFSESNPPSQQTSVPAPQTETSTTDALTFEASEASTTETPRPVTSKRASWSPALIVWMSLIFSPIAGGLLYALNFGRLGYPSRRNTALWWLGAWGLFYVLLVLRLGIVDVKSYIATNQLRPFLFLLTCLFAWRFYLSQQPLFVRHMREGGRKASLLSALFIVLIGAIPILAAPGLLVDYAQSVQLQKGSKLLLTGEPQKLREAEKIFKGLISRDPQNAAYHFFLALAYWDTDREKEAIREARESLRLDPTDKEVREMLAEMEDSYLPE